MKKTTAFRTAVRFIFLLCITHFLIPVLGVTKAQSRVDSLYLAASPDYSISGFGEFFLGSHWRLAWGTPLWVKVLRLDTLSGGLRPLKLGGGLQTKTLHFIGANGLRYKFRSLNKDPKKVLSEELRLGLAADVVQDQISASFPYSIFISSSFQKQLGILSSPPELYVMPDDSILGEYRTMFAGLLGTLELNPKGLEGEGEDFETIEKIEDTIGLLKKLEKDSEDQVDAAALLRVRLLDVFMGDWDRHVGQWKFSRITTSTGIKTWQAIPQDRDQAFARYDGILPWVGTQILPQIKSFGSDFPSANFATWSGRYMDRRLYGSLSRAKWDSVTASFLETLKEDSIRIAVKMLPNTIYKQSGEWILTSLLERRKKLKSLSDDYYLLMAEEAEVYGSQKKERFDIFVESDGSIRVKGYRLKKNGSIDSSIIFYRQFYPKETSEVRIHLGEGDDIVSINGFQTPIRIRVLTEGGKDSIQCNAKVETICHAGKNDILTGSEKRYLNRSNIKVIDFPLDSLNFKNPPRDFGSQWWFDLVFRYASEYGIILGYKPNLITYGFQKIPYQSSLSISAAYSPSTTRGVLDVTFDSPFAFGEKGNLGFESIARASQLEVIRFYGVGNETVFSDSLDESRHYLARQTHYSLYNGCYFKLFDQLRLKIGLESKFVFSEPDEDDATTKLLFISNTYGSRDLFLLKANATMIYDSRNQTLNPTNGILFESSFSSIPNIFGARTWVSKFRTDLRIYFSMFNSGDVFAMRATHEKVIGDAPFFELASVGGKRSIRGFDQQRFLGNESLVFAAEWRQKLFRFAFIVPTDFGLISFAETGRVYLENETSSLWHPGFGGGFWLAFVDANSVLSFTLGGSREFVGFYSAIGFTF
ncbi:MAG: BamA/TamA family outer membrane protein [Chloroherpetonaceae bacterium]|nr:BamA/TamA family outer membrane protein [Chloroherpetonaceae bacterium]